MRYRRGCVICSYTVDKRLCSYDCHHQYHHHFHMSTMTTTSFHKQLYCQKIWPKTLFSPIKNRLYSRYFYDLGLDSQVIVLVIIFCIGCKYFIDILDWCFVLCILLKIDFFKFHIALHCKHRFNWRRESWKPWECRAWPGFSATTPRFSSWCW